MIRAALFDMDGLLIDSEPFWREALKRTFPKVGITLTDDMCVQTMGLRINEVIAYWHSIKPWDGMTFAALENEIIDTVGQLVQERGEPLEGVDHILNFFRQRHIPIGLATSSSARLIGIVLRKLDLEDCFDVAHSAENESFGKPHPAVYLSASRKLNTSPAECIAFEDSANGLLSARAAGMKTVVVPDKVSRDLPVFANADIKLNSLLEFTERHFDTLQRTSSPS